MLCTHISPGREMGQGGVIIIFFFLSYNNIASVLGQKFSFSLMRGDPCSLAIIIQPYLKLHDELLSRFNPRRTMQRNILQEIYRPRSFHPKKKRKNSINSSFFFLPHTHIYQFAILSEIHTQGVRGKPPPRLLPWPPKRVYETIKLFSFPFLTLKRNGKHTEGAARRMNARGWPWVWGGSSSAGESREIRGKAGRKGRKNYYFPVTLGLVSMVALGGSTSFTLFSCCCSKFLPCGSPSYPSVTPQLTFLPSPPLTQNACGLHFAKSCKFSSMCLCAATSSYSSIHKGKILYFRWKNHII